MGLIAWIRRFRKPKKRYVPPSREQLQTVHEYRNFFSYNGESQTAVPFGEVRSKK